MLQCGFFDDQKKKKACGRSGVAAKKIIGSQRHSLLREVKVKNHVDCPFAGGANVVKVFKKNYIVEFILGCLH